MWFYREPLVNTKGEAKVEGQGRSNCNLPAICHQCRGGRDGQHKRPPADLMAALPCGFCRCQGDLDEPTLITLPPATPQGDAPVAVVEQLPEGGAAPSEDPPLKADEPAPEG